MSHYREDIKLPSGRIGRIRSISEIAASLDWSINYSKKKLTAATRDYSWTGTDNPEEYVDMLRNGWKAGVTGVEGLDGLSSDAMDQLTWTYDVAGSFPCIPRCIAGHPQRMMRATRSAKSKRGLTLVFDGTYNASVEPEEVLEYARAVMRLVAWLSANQIEAAVYCAGSTSHGSTGVTYTYLVPIRRAGEAMQPERIATTLHPAFLRRGLFSMREHEKYVAKLPTTINKGGGYGSSRKTHVKDLTSLIDECYAVVMLPKVGEGDPTKAVHDALNFKLAHKEVTS